MKEFKFVKKSKGLGDKLNSRVGSVFSLQAILTKDKEETIVLTKCS